MWQTPGLEQLVDGLSGHTKDRSRLCNAVKDTSSRHTSIYFSRTKYWMRDIIFLGQESADFYGTIGTGVVEMDDPYARCALTTGPRGELLNPLYSGTLVENIEPEDGEWFYSQYLNTDALGEDIGVTPFVSFWNFYSRRFGFGVRREAGLARLTFIAGGEIVAEGADQSFVSGGKLDFAINPTTGRVRGWCNGQLAFDNIVEAVNAIITRFEISTPSLGQQGKALHWGICIARFDLREYRLATLVPNEDTAIHDWVGSFEGVTGLDYRKPTIGVNANSNGAVSAMGLTNLPTGTFAVRGVKVCGMFLRGVTPLTKAAVGIDTGTGVISYGSAMQMYNESTPVAAYFDNNPLDGSDFIQQQINNLKLAIQATGDEPSIDVTLTANASLNTSDLLMFLEAEGEITAANAIENCYVYLVVNEFESYVQYNRYNDDFSKFTITVTSPEGVEKTYRFGVTADTGEVPGDGGGDDGGGGGPPMFSEVRQPDGGYKTRRGTVPYTLASPLPYPTGTRFKIKEYDAGWTEPFDFLSTANSTIADLLAAVAVLPIYVTVDLKDGVLMLFGDDGGNYDMVRRLGGESEWRHADRMFDGTPVADDRTSDNPVFYGEIDPAP